MVVLNIHVPKGILTEVILDESGNELRRWTYGMGLLRQRGEWVSIDVAYEVLSSNVDPGAACFYGEIRTVVRPVANGQRNRRQWTPFLAGALFGAAIGIALLAWL